MRRDATWLIGLALLLGCGKTVDPLPNKNTNWLRECVVDATCGQGLTCVCGVCTMTCTTATECEAQGDGVACESTTSTALEAQCRANEVDQERAICVASCGGSRDCEVYGSDWECRDAVCSKVVPRDAGDGAPLDGNAAGGTAMDSGQLGDGAAVSAGSGGAMGGGSGGGGGELEPLDAGTVERAEVMCEGDTGLAGTGPFAVVATELFDTGRPPLAIAPDGAIYTTYATAQSGGYLALMRIEGSMAEPFASGDHFPAGSTLLVDGGDLLVGWYDSSSDGDGVITKVDLATQAPVHLARELEHTVLGIAAEGEWVYWMSRIYDPPSPQGRIWRSPRTPGDSQMLGEVEGGPLQDTLFVAGGALFLLAQWDEGVSMYRVAEDGSGGAQKLSNAPPGLADMRFDGQDAFLALGGVDALGNPSGAHGIARMNPGTLESQMLFDTGEATPSRLTLDETYVYWFIDEGFDDDKPSGAFWRGRKDGRGDAQELASLHGWMSAFAAHGGSLYWIAGCETPDGNSHLVRVPSP